MILSRFLHFRAKNARPKAVKIETETYFITFLTFQRAFFRVRLIVSKIDFFVSMITTYDVTRECPVTHAQTIILIIRNVSYMQQSPKKQTNAKYYREFVPYET